MSVIQCSSWWPTKVRQCGQIATSLGISCLHFSQAFLGGCCRASAAATASAGLAGLAGCLGAPGRPTGP